MAADGSAHPDPVSIPAADRFPLAASWFGPKEPENVILIAPATGVPRRFYEAFARFLSRSGFGVLTWDWRGIGENRPPDLRGFQATMRDWAEQDLAGAVSWAAARFPRARLVALGHSFGGQVMGLAPNAGRLTALVTVASQSGYWGHWPRPRRYGYAMLWYVGMPLVTRMMGYFPSRLLGLGEDLPRGVALEWARWCRNPDYLGDYEGHRAFEGPILAFSFSDDPYAPRTAVEALHERYASASVVHRHLTPGDVGAERIGHFGFFREGTAPDLWVQTVAWLKEQRPSRSGTSAPDGPQSEKGR